MVYLDRERLVNAVEAGAIRVYRSINGYLVFPDDVPQNYLLRVTDRFLGLNLWTQKGYEEVSFPPLAYATGAGSSAGGEPPSLPQATPVTIQGVMQMTQQEG